MKSIALTVAIAAMVGWATPPRSFGDGLTYPYVASPERQEQIRTGMTNVTQGMSPSDVEAILGKPDEVRKLYGRIKQAEPVGYTWWFIVQRKAESGSVNDKAEKLVRVSFTLNDRVTRVDATGMEQSDNQAGVGGHHGNHRDDDQVITPYNRPVRQTHEVPPRPPNPDALSA